MIIEDIQKDSNCSHLILNATEKKGNQMTKFCLNIFQ